MTLWEWKLCFDVFDEQWKLCIFCINLHILIRNTEITDGEVVGDSVIPKTKLCHFHPGPFSPWDVLSLGNFLPTLFWVCFLLWGIEWCSRNKWSSRNTPKMAQGENSKIFTSINKTTHQKIPYHPSAFQLCGRQDSVSVLTERVYRW